MRTSSLLALAFAASLTLLAGCGSTGTCESICERYQDCFDTDYDVGACVDRCVDNADASEQFESRLETCDICAHENSCSGAFFSCANDCRGIVP